MKLSMNAWAHSRHIDPERGGLAGTITYITEEYEQNALALARERTPRRQSGVSWPRLSCNQFDTERYTRHLEVATQEYGRCISAARSQKASDVG